MSRLGVENVFIFCSCSDAGLVILPAYYAASLNPDQDQVVQYYIDICENSPVRKSVKDESYETRLNENRSRCFYTTSRPMQVGKTCHLKSSRL